MDETTVRELMDRLQITDVLNRIHVFYDRRQWPDVRACFSDEVEMDYTSVGGGEPSKVKMDDQIEQWKAGVAGF